MSLNVRSTNVQQICKQVAGYFKIAPVFSMKQDGGCEGQTVSVGLKGDKIKLKIVFDVIE